MFASGKNLTQLINIVNAADTEYLTDLKKTKNKLLQDKFNELTKRLSFLKARMITKEMQDAVENMQHSIQKIEKLARTVADNIFQSLINTRQHCIGLARDLSTNLQKSPVKCEELRRSLFEQATQFHQHLGFVTKSYTPLAHLTAYISKVALLEQQILNASNPKENLPTYSQFFQPSRVAATPLKFNAEHGKQLRIEEQTERAKSPVI